MSDAERFVERFAARWRDLDPATFVEVYHPDATIRSPQTRRPVGRAELSVVVARTKAMMPDLHWEVRDWAARGTTVFVEWRITATVAGERVTWDGIDRFTLAGDLALEEVVHFDTLPLWERLDPTMRRPALLAP